MALKRKPPKGNVRRVTFISRNSRGIVTNKAGNIVQYESWAERILLLRLDRDPDVENYTSQPERFEYIDDEGKRHTYVPDFKVQRSNGEVEIHEVTRSERRTRPDIQRREKAARKICQERGWRYIVHTEKTLPQPTEEANLLALYRYRSDAYANPDVARAAYERLEAAGRPIFLCALVTQIAGDLNLPEPTVVNALCHLIWHGKIETDLNKLLFIDGALVPNAVVWVEHKKGE